MIRPALLLLFAYLMPSTVAANSVPPAYQSIADRHGIPGDLLFALVTHESGTTTTAGRFLPWPWTINHRGKGLWFASREEMYHYAKQLTLQGDKLFDLGPAQVNFYHHGEKFDSLWAATDPMVSLEVGASFLSHWYERERDWWQAIGRYHSPGRPEHAERYRQKVRKQWESIFGL